MKTIKVFAALLALIFITSNIFAKNHTIGLYLTAADYQNHKLSFEKGAETGAQISISGIAGGRKVLVAHDGKKDYYLKTEIFGYQKDGQDYRFYDYLSFKILATKGIYLYVIDKLIYEGKGPKPKDFYYFSASPTDALKALTMDNLQVVYAKNTKFLYSVTGYFKSDDDLIAFDTTIKMYKLEYLFYQSNT